MWIVGFFREVQARPEEPADHIFNILLRQGRSRSPAGLLWATGVQPTGSQA
jgi:hypothetical protein